MTRGLRARALALLAAMLACCTPVWAHKPSDSYLSLTVRGQAVEGQWDIALRDLDFAIGLDSDGNGELTWGEVNARKTAIAAYAMSRFAMSSGGAACPGAVRDLLVDDHTDGAYAVLRFSARCPSTIDSLDVDYRLLFDLDPQHEGLLKITMDGRTSTAIFTPNSHAQAFKSGGDGQLAQFGAYARTGVWHIWIGFDHILFLLSLLLPAVLTRSGARWVTAPSFKVALVEVLKIVTAFTLAHSITLTLATLQVIALPSRWVESSIALSVIFAALNNIWPLVSTRRWIAAFCFGLIHGFGFASVLTDLGLPKASLLLALIGFNVGVEIGQLAIVGAFLPLAFAARKTWAYRKLVFLGGSGAIALVATIWFAERAFNLRLITP